MERYLQDHRTKERKLTEAVDSLLEKIDGNIKQLILMKNELEEALKDQRK